MMMLTQLPAAASVPFFVWGPVTVAAALLLSLLPDTLGTSIPETMQVQLDTNQFPDICYKQAYISNVVSLCCGSICFVQTVALSYACHAVDLMRSGEIYALATSFAQHYSHAQPARVLCAVVATGCALASKFCALSPFCQVCAAAAQGALTGIKLCLSSLSCIFANVASANFVLKCVKHSALQAQQAL